MLAKSTNPSPYGNCFYPRYMMLSLESCESNDKRPFGAFFTYFSDEMSDIIWIQDFQLLFLLLRELPADNHAVCSNQEALRKYESTMNEIVLSNKIYEYLYIFLPVFKFPLLHPVPFSREESKDSYEKNHILREEEIKTKFKEFKEKEYSLDKLIELAVKEKYSILGEVLAQFYCDGLFDEKIFSLLLQRDEEGKYVYGYVSYLHRNGTVDLNEVIGMVKKLSNNKNLLVNLISLDFIEDNDNALITKEDEEIKKMYWSGNVKLGISDKAGHKVVMWALDECKKYGSLHTYLELLYDIKDKISFQELYNAIFVISNLKDNVVSSMTDYYLEEILKELQDAFIMDDEKCAELATLFCIQ